MDYRELPEKVMQERKQILTFFLKGDQNAIKFCEDILFICHLWDDMIDKDKTWTDQDINDAFNKSLSEIPLNPFYQAYFPVLVGMMTNAINQWHVSNVLIKGNGDDRLTAFILLEAIFTIVYYAMSLTGGQQWAIEQGTHFWRYFNKGLEKSYRQDMEV